MKEPKGFSDWDWEERIKWYKKNGFTEKAKQDENSYIRLNAYQILGFTEKAKKDKYWVIRLTAYGALGFTEEAKKDSERMIRLKAYQDLGFTEEAKQDKDPDIRLEAYQTLGFTEEAKHDISWKIRLTAYQALGFTKEAFLDKTQLIRLLAAQEFGWELLGSFKNSPEENELVRARKHYELTKEKPKAISFNNFQERCIAHSFLDRDQKEENLTYILDDFNSVWFDRDYIHLLPKEDQLKLKLMEGLK